MDIRTLMGRAARHYSQREAIVHGERRLTFAEAWRRGINWPTGCGPWAYSR